MNEEHTIISGADIDKRPVQEQEKDFKFEEIVASANPVNWVEKTEYRKFPIFNQNGSGSCVAQTTAKEMGVMRWLKDGKYVHFSATDIYQRRKNRPAGGMWATDARDIIRKGGATLEVLAPSQDMTDQEMDNFLVDEYMREVGEVFKVPNYVTLPIQDIDAVASVIETTGKAVMVWFYFKYDEWNEYPQIKHLDINYISPGVVRHSVTAVDYTLKNGKKCLVIEDQWGIGAGQNGQRIIDEDFFKARNWYSGYLVNFRFDDKTKPEPSQPSPQKPTYTFRETLRFSAKFSVNDDVKHLQKILKFEGLFPSNTAITGYYGSITARAVLQWQKKYKIASDSELDNLRGQIVGPKTRAMLNALYGE